MTMPIDGPADDETYYAQGWVLGRTYS